MNAQRLNRVWDRLAQPRISRAVRRPAVRLRWALVVGVVLLSAGAMAAAGAWTWPGAVVRRLMAPSRGLDKVLPTASSAVVRRRRVSSEVGTPGEVAQAPRLEPAGPATGEPPAPLPATAPPASEQPFAGRTAGARPLRPPPPPAPTPCDSQLAEESQFVGRALVQLRQARDTDGALAELDRYTQRFPSGILQHEALAVRVDALLLAGRAAEAQAILSRLTLASTARDRELRLIRAELATETDCASALNDFRTVWNAHPAGTWGERALWGQAVCAARLGDEARARLHLTRYLAQFPDGPHADEARIRLRE